MGAVDNLLGRLEHVKKSGDGWQARCPAHADRIASLSIKEGDDGRALLRCFAGCATEAVVSALGLGLADLFEPRDNGSAPRPAPARKQQKPAPTFAETDVARFRETLLANGAALERLLELRGWTREACERLGLGLDDGRVTFPFRDAKGLLVGIGRYAPNPGKRDGSKMVAAPGSKRVLFPTVEAVDVDRTVWICEGEPDAVRATSLGLAAVGVPGVQGWRSGWASRFAGRVVVVCMDCDRPGREAAQRIAAELADHAAEVRVLDLDPDRDDGYDLSDFTAAATTAEQREQARAWLEDCAERTPTYVDRGSLSIDSTSSDDGAAAAADGAELLDELARFVRSYVVVTPEQADTLALWIVHTHGLAAADCTPYIAITSAEKRCGKSTLLATLRLLVREPLPTVNISDAALFRVVAAKSPTLLMDEVDAIFGAKARDREDLRGLINSGHSRGQHAYRMGGPNRDQLHEFPTFCPKVLAGIGELPDTIADRSIPIRLKRKAPGETCLRFRRRDVEPAAAPLKARAAGWAQANLDALTAARPDLPDALDDRAADSWEPLLAIADLAGAGWGQRARCAAVELHASRDHDDDSLGVRLLADIRALLDRLHVDRIATGELLDHLHADDEAPWADYFGKPLSPRQLARLLKRYGVRPSSIRTPDGKTPRGFLRDWLEDAFSRYLPRESATSATLAQPSQKQGVSHPQHDPSVADREWGANPHGYAEVADVADKRRGDGSGALGDGPFELFAEAS